MEKLIELAKIGCERALKNMKIKEVDFGKISNSAF